MDRRGWTLIAGALAIAAALSWRPFIEDGAAPAQSAAAAPATKVEVAATPEVEIDAHARAGTADLLAALANETAPSVPPPPPPVFSEPLPAWDAKLVDVLPALKARADAGDPVAACHIGLALSACASWMDHQPSPARLRQIDPADKDAIDRMARSATDLIRPGREKSCEGLPESALTDRFDYLQQAADAGNVAAMRAYAEGVPLQGANAFVRHPEWLEAHRQRAPRYMTELIRRGDRYAAVLLYLNTDGMQVSPLAQALKMDQVTAATFWYLGREVMAETGVDWTAGTPDLNRAAQARARIIYGRYFEQHPFQSGELIELRDMMDVERCRPSS